MPFDQTEKAAMEKLRAHLVLHFASNIAGPMLSSGASLPAGDSQFQVIWHKAENLVDAMPEGIMRALADMPLPLPAGGEITPG